tara:strand:- start:5777 stop:6004 length:228 start_codon:yes stop_codon:yes gene_type:complete
VVDDWLLEFFAEHEPVLHVAQSKYHDISQASALGLDTVWIDRPRANGAGATRTADATPTWSFSNLEDFAAALLSP